MLCVIGYSRAQQKGGFSITEWLEILTRREREGERERERERERVRESGRERRQGDSGIAF